MACVPYECGTRPSFGTLCPQPTPPAGTVGATGGHLGTQPTSRGQTRAVTAARAAPACRSAGPAEGAAPAVWPGSLTSAAPPCPRRRREEPPLSSPDRKDFLSNLETQEGRRREEARPSPGSAAASPAATSHGTRVAFARGSCLNDKLVTCDCHEVTHTTGVTEGRETAGRLPVRLTLTPRVEQRPRCG